MPVLNGVSILDCKIAETPICAAWPSSIYQYVVRISIKQRCVKRDVSKVEGTIDISQKRNERILAKAMDVLHPKHSLLVNHGLFIDNGLYDSHLI